MALRWVEGWEVYGVDRSLPEDGVWFYTAGVPNDVVAGVARTGSRSFRIAGGGASAQAIRSVGASGNTFGLGFAVQYGATGTAAGGLCSFLRASDETQVSLGLVYDAATDRFKLQVQRGVFGVGTAIAESAPVFDRLSFEHIEMRVLVHSSAGSVEVRLNEVTVISATGLNTQALGSDAVDFIQLGPGGTGFQTLYYDDVFLWDTAGGANDTFLGAQRVYMIYPDGDTAQSDWTRNQGSTDFENIAETTPDDDTTYIDAAAAADVSEFSLGSLPAEVTAVAGCQIYYRSRKDSSGACDVQPALISAGQVALGDNRPLAESWAYQGPIQDVIENDPDTGAPWTPAALNAALLRFTRTA